MSLYLVDIHGDIEGDYDIIRKYEEKVGEWNTCDDGTFRWYECSECGYVIQDETQYHREYDPRTNYCPNCGAKMLGGNNHGEDEKM